MKVGLITLHAVQNFGSVLQTYATSEILKSMGHDVFLIDYRRSRDLMTQGIVSGWKDVDKNIVQKILSVGYKLFEVPCCTWNFNRFLNNHFRLTKRYHSIEELRTDPPQMDAYITGSDQVWNSEYNGGVDKTYFLEFAPENSIKVSYASSFGFDSLPTEEVTETKRLLEQYQAISVREKQGLKILEDLGISSGTHVLDPTLLLNKQDWSALMTPVTDEPPYLMFYSVEGRLTRDAFRCAQRIAEARNLKIYQVVVGGPRQGISGCDKLFTFKRPEFFLSLMMGAEYVVASSFHGTAFAVNMEKPFISVFPGRFKGRAASLLRLLNIEDRGVGPQEFDLDVALSSINYEAVRARLESQRIQSLRYIKNAFEQ